MDNKSMLDFVNAEVYDGDMKIPVCSAYVPYMPLGMNVISFLIHGYINNIGGQAGIKTPLTKFEYVKGSDINIEIKNNQLISISAPTIKNTMYKEIFEANKKISIDYDVIKASIERGKYIKFIYKKDKKYTYEFYPIDTTIDLALGVTEESYDNEDKLFSTANDYLRICMMLENIISIAEGDDTDILDKEIEKDFVDKQIKRCDFLSNEINEFINVKLNKDLHNISELKEKYIEELKKIM